MRVIDTTAGVNLSDPRGIESYWNGELIKALYFGPKRVSTDTRNAAYPEACGLRHLAFHVPDVRQTVQELSALGIACEPIREDEFTQRRMTFFFDPDGLPLELHE